MTTIEVTQPLFKLSISAPLTYRLKVTQTILQGPPGPDSSLAPRESFQMISSRGNIFTITLDESLSGETSFIATPVQ